MLIETWKVFEIKFENILMKNAYKWFCGTFILMMDIRLCQKFVVKDDGIYFSCITDKNIYNIYFEYLQFYF